MGAAPILGSGTTGAQPGEVAGVPFPSPPSSSTDVPHLNADALSVEALPSTIGVLSAPSSPSHPGWLHADRPHGSFRDLAAPYGRVTASSHRSHFAGGVRCPVEGRRLHRSLGIHGRGVAGQRAEPRTVAGLRVCSSAVQRLTARQRLVVLREGCLRDLARRDQLVVMDDAPALRSVTA